jgi:hypothetical protein
MQVVVWREIGVSEKKASERIRKTGKENEEDAMKAPMEPHVGTTTNLITEADGTELEATGKRHEDVEVRKGRPRTKRDESSF